MKKTLLLFTLLFTIMFVKAQSTRQVTGTVTDNLTKETVIGASILVKGTTTGTQTDVDGKFKISVPATGEVTLVVRYIGYKTQEIVVGTRSAINVSLESEAKQLDEVVAIGYATVNRRDLTGSVSSVAAMVVT